MGERSRKWVRGGRVPGMLFATGDEVEVSSDEEGFRGAWFEAKVVRSLPRANRYMLVYDHLISDENDPTPLRETVDACFVRPRSPRRGGPFSVHCPVDACYKDGWWVGVVSAVVPAASSEAMKYVVRFPNTREEIEFKAADLRHHFEWVADEWVETGERDMVNSDNLLTIPERSVVFERGTKVEVRSDEEGFRGAWYAATVVKLLRGDRFVVEYEALRTDDDTEFLKETVDARNTRPVPHASVVKKFNRLVEVDAFYNDGWWIGVISKILKRSRYMVYFKDSKEELEFGASELRLHVEWINGQWIQTSQMIRL